jgi:hypothetical protein
MKKLVLVCWLLVSALSLMAQKVINDPNAESRDVKGFHAVKVSSGIELLLTQGSSEAVAVSASATEFRDRIKTVVEDGVLKIYYDHSYWKEARHKKLKAYVAVVNIDRLEANSGASVKMESSLKSDKLAIGVSSGAVVNGQVEASALSIDQSSGSVMHLSGSAAQVTVEGSSGSVFRGYELVADNCDVGTSSGAGVQITVNKELSAKASSGGYIRYKGEGVIRNIRTGSGGSVSKN